MCLARDCHSLLFRVRTKAHLFNEDSRDSHITHSSCESAASFSYSCCCSRTFLALSRLASGE